MDTEKLEPQRKRTEPVRASNLDEVWPVRSAGAWPKDLSLRREDLYDERGIAEIDSDASRREPEPSD